MRYHLFRFFSLLVFLFPIYLFLVSHLPDVISICSSNSLVKAKLGCACTKQCGEKRAKASNRLILVFELVQVGLFIAFVVCCNRAISATLVLCSSQAFVLTICWTFCWTGFQCEYLFYKFNILIVYLYAKLNKASGILRSTLAKSFD